jgi:hypothetical protein
VEVINPDATAASVGNVRLKFSTRGTPDNFTYLTCKRDSECIQVRHQLRVATRWHNEPDRPPANVVLDLAVIKDGDLQALGTSDFVSNEMLITFGEAKHMSAFAELIASFIGMVHEMMPQHLNGAQSITPPRPHLAPFLYVSGTLYTTAEGILKTIQRRKLDLEVYWQTNQLLKGLQLPLMTPKSLSNSPVPKKEVTTATSST